MAETPKVVKKDGATRFHRMAKRAGGISRDEAIKRSNAFLETAKSKYHEWVAEDVLRLETALAALRGQTEPDPEALENAYHRTRVIRDLGDTMGYPLVTVVADSLCELLYRFKNANVYSERSVDTHFWSLQLVSTPAYKGEAKEATDNLLSGLRRVVDTFPPVDPAAGKPERN